MVAAEIAAAMESTGRSILVFINYGITALVILFIVELGRLFLGGKDSEVQLDQKGKDLGQKAWKKVVGFPKARATKAIKKGMNEYVLEEREEAKLNEIKKEVNVVVVDIEALQGVIASRPVLSSEARNLVKIIKALKDKINDAKNYYRGVNKQTLRAQTGIDKMFKYIKDKGVEDDDLVGKVKVYEEDILKQHMLAAKEVAKLVAEYGSVSSLAGMKKLDKAATELRPTTSPTDAELDALLRVFESMIAIIETACEHQTKAKQELQGIIALVRDL